MLEAVMVAKVLVLLALGVAFVVQAQQARGRAHQLAFYCALSHAQSACTRVAPACEHAPPSEHTEHVEEAPDLVAHALTRSSTSTGDLDPFSEIAVLGTAFGALFGQTAHAVVHEPITSPFHSGGAAASQEAAFLCNEKSQSGSDLALSIFNSLFNPWD
jgi:hypothetical protein